MGHSDDALTSAEQEIARFCSSLRAAEPVGGTRRSTGRAARDAPVADAAVNGSGEANGYHTAAAFIAPRAAATGAWAAGSGTRRQNDADGVGIGQAGAMGRRRDHRRYSLELGDAPTATALPMDVVMRDWVHTHRWQILLLLIGAAIFLLPGLDYWWPR